MEQKEFLVKFTWSEGGTMDIKEKGYMPYELKLFAMCHYISAVCRANESKGNQLIPPNMVRNLKTELDKLR